MKNKFNAVKKSIVSVISGISLIFIIWLVFFGKIKAAEFLTPLLQKIPRNQTGLTNITDKILGEATKAINNENLKKATQKGSEFFENSSYAKPARDIREDVKKKVEDTIQSAKELPAQELKTIQRQICAEWLKDDNMATGSTGN